MKWLVAFQGHSYGPRNLSRAVVFTLEIAPDKSIRNFQFPFVGVCICERECYWDLPRAFLSLRLYWLNKIHFLQFNSIPPERYLIL